MKTAIALAAALSVLPAVSQTPLTPEQAQAKCAAEGGCLTMTRAQLMEALVNAHQIGLQKGFDQGERRCSKSI